MAFELYGKSASKLTRTRMRVAQQQPAQKAPRIQRAVDLTSRPTLHCKSRSLARSLERQYQYAGRRFCSIWLGGAGHNWRESSAAHAPAESRSRKQKLFVVVVVVSCWLSKCQQSLFKQHSNKHRRATNERTPLIDSARATSPTQAPPTSIHYTLT